MRKRFIVYCLLFGWLSGSVLRADIVVEMTTVGNPGNSADWTGLGSVDYTYQISTYEVTVGSTRSS